MRVKCWCWWVDFTTSFVSLVRRQTDRREVLDSLRRDVHIKNQGYPDNDERKYWQPADLGLFDNPNSIPYFDGKKKTVRSKLNHILHIYPCRDIDLYCISIYVG